ncbi:ATP-binding protein [Streptomyces paludis]|uniref:ATP-binding protein n=2 Tax=Streptomyces paludis TaxID=2282738 RepID=A0A345HRA8_9ACTN|nr:ATP-binding protein [Streptomyces paludis]
MEFPMPELLAQTAVQDALGQSPSGRSRTLGAQWEATLTVTERGIAYIRHAVRAHLRRWDREDAEAVTLLGVSELLTNVLRHAGTPEARIAVRAESAAVYVVVSDLDRRFPVVGAADLLSEDGRGLAMLEALADGFGVTATPSGKDVWFRVARSGARRPGGRGGGT